MYNYVLILLKGFIYVLYYQFKKLGCARPWLVRIGVVRPRVAGLGRVGAFIGRVSVAVARLFALIYKRGGRCWV